jgi:hypothetical protein
MGAADGTGIAVSTGGGCTDTVWQPARTIRTQNNTAMAAVKDRSLCGEQIGVFFDENNACGLSSLTC